MYMASFMFEQSGYDEAFYALDQVIQKVADRMDGFMGRESWQSADGKRKNAVYYWRDLESLTAFARDEKHQQAKQQYKKWYDGFQVVIAKVEHTYGDGQFDHLLAQPDH